MKIRLVGLGIAFALLCISSRQGVAQQQVATAPSPHKAMHTAAPFNTRISVKLDRVTLKQAVTVIAAKASVRVQYQAELLDAVKAPVSVHAEGLTLGDVLTHVLAGTHLVAVAPVPGVITIQQHEIDERTRQGTIVGKVIHAKTRKPVMGVTVLLNDALQGISTSEDGSFRITAAAGEHTIRVRGVGFVRQAKRVTVSGESTVVLDFVLEPSASVLDEVVVTGTVIATARKEIATPITVITGEELEKRGITRIEQLFRGEVPGLLVLERGSAAYSSQDLGQGVSSTIYARGSASLDGSANPVKTYVDGIELVDPSYLGTIDPRSIEKIEIITGPQAATIYGSGAMGGVMQIFTKRGSLGGVPEINLTVKYGMLQNNFSRGLTPAHNDAITLRGGTGPELTYSGSLSYDYTGQWQPKLYNGRHGASLGATHTRGQLTVSAAFSASTTRQGTWRSGLGSNYGIYQLLKGPEAEYRGRNIEERFYSEWVSLSSNQMVSLNTDIRVTPTWSHHLTLGKSQNLMNLKPQAPNFSYGNIGSDTLFIIQRLNGQRLTWNYNTSLTSSWHVLSSSLTLGANGSAGDQLYVAGGTVSTSASTIVGTSGTGGAIVNVPMNDQSWGAFGNWRIGLFSQLYTTLGLRVERNPRYGRDVKFDLTPTNGLTYTLEHGAVAIKLMGSYGRATRPPLADQQNERWTLRPLMSPSQYLSQLANAELRPEYSHGPQGGIEVYVGNLVSLTVNHYRQTVTDLIQEIKVDSVEQCPISGGSCIWNPQAQWQNIAKIRQVGWEGTAALQAGPLTLKGAYSWNDSYILEIAPGAYYQIGVARQAFYNLPTHTANVTVGYARGLMSAMLVTNYVGQVISNNQDDLMYNQVTYTRYPMYRVISNSARLAYYRSHPGYAKSDLVASHRVSPKLTLTLNILNVGNGFESDISELNPSLGRQTTLGFSYRFGRK